MPKSSDTTPPCQCIGAAHDLAHCVGPVLDHVKLGLGSWFFIYRGSLESTDPPTSLLSTFVNLAMSMAGVQTLIVGTSGDGGEERVGTIFESGSVMAVTAAW